MREDYQQIFSKLSPPEPSGDLLAKIIARIGEERKAARIKWRLVLFSAVTVCSAVAFVPLFQMLRTGFIESGFLQFFSLLFSDFEIVAAYWQNFSLSLLETLPVFSLMVFLAVVLVFLESLKLLIKNLKIFLFRHN